MLIEFKFSGNGAPVSVDPERIAAVYAAEPGGRATFLDMGGTDDGADFKVEGTYDETVAKIITALELLDPPTCGHGTPGLCMFCLREAIAEGLRR
jgi:hypothetical protein